MSRTQRTNITYRLAKQVSLLGNARHFTVRTLSKKSNISDTTVYRILNSAIRPYNPSLKTITKLAGAFNMTLSQFLDIGVTAKVARSVK